MVAWRFRAAIREALSGIDLASVISEGQGVILHAGIGDGVLAIAAALSELHVPVVVVEPEPEKRQADARFLMDIPVVSNTEEAVQLFAIATKKVTELIVLTPATIPNPEAAFSYLQQIGLLPDNLQPQAILAVGLEEGNFREQMGNYL